MRGESISVSFIDSAKYVKSDPSTPPLLFTPIFTSVYNREIKKEFRPLDPSGTYVVFTSNAPSHTSFCAFHGDIKPGRNSHLFVAAYIPNPNDGGCDVNNEFNLSGSETLLSLADLTSHEFMEMITDPDIGTGWFDLSGITGEMADKCQGQYDSPVSLANHSVWQLQELWSNDFNAPKKVGGCTQTTV